jgi:malate permease and related proteins
MLTVFSALAVIALAGACVRYVVPNFDVDAARRHVGMLVLYALLPALNVEVVYQARLDGRLWQIPVVMLVGVLVCVGCALAVFRLFPVDRNLKNSLILGCAFGNVTYLGMPLLRGLFPDRLVEVTEIAILCEITVTSADLITGTLLAVFYQQSEQRAPVRAALLQIVKFPLIWSLALTILIRMIGVPLPSFMLMALHLMGQSTSGVMLLVLGMAIKPDALMAAFRHFGSWWPMLAIKLGLSPLVVMFAGATIGLSTLNFHATTLEAAMPPQLFVFIVADRFGFDTEVLAAAVAFLTVLSFFTLPIVHHLLPG